MKIAINGEILEVSGGGGLPEGTVAVKPLTQVEYDALTNEEKQADVAYAITDDKGSGSSNSSVDNNVYSTEEVRVGTWFGKPLYRKTSGNVSIVGETNVIIPISELTDAGVFVSVQGVVKNKTTNVTISIPFTSPASGSAYIGVNRTVGVFVGATDLTGYECYAWVEYTKTTDTGGTT